MKHETYPLITRLSIAAIALSLSIPLVLSAILTVLSIYYFCTGFLSCVDPAVAIVLTALQLGGCIAIKGLDISSSRKLINKMFWDTVPRHTDWLRAVQPGVLVSTAAFTLCYLFFACDAAWHFATHRIVPSLAAANVPELSELTHLYSSSFPDEVSNFGLGLAVLIIAFIGILLKVLLPRQIRHWYEALATADDDAEKIHLLDLIATTNLYIDRHTEAEKASSLMLRLADKEAKLAS